LRGFKNVLKNKVTINHPCAGIKKQL